jgi:hypothetical protein
MTFDWADLNLDAELERVRGAAASRVIDDAVSVDLQRVRVAGRAAWMQARGVDGAPSGRQRRWLGPWWEFWIRAAGEWRSRSMDTPRWLSRAHQIMGCLPKDHTDNFFRAGVTACVIAQPYLSSWRAEDHAKWEDIAMRYRLTLERSVEASWHFPGLTVLYALWLPQDALEAKR